MKSYALLGQGNFWIISKPLAKIVGIEAALLLSDLVSKHQYFSKRDKIDTEGRFFNTAENIENDTTLSPHKQRKAIKILKDFNLVYTKIKGVPAKLWYGVNDLCICELIDIITDLKTIDKDSLEQAVKKFNSWKLNNLTTINKNKGNKNKEIIKKSKPKKDLEIKPKMKRTKKKPLPDFYLQYNFFTKDFSEIWFKEFLPMKQRKKASVSDRALKSQLKKIAQYSSNNHKTALEILTNSVDAGWSDVYPIKNNNKPNNQTNNWGTLAYSDTSIDFDVQQLKDQDGNIIREEIPYDER